MTNGNVEHIVESKSIEGEIYYIIKNILSKNGLYSLRNKRKIVDKIAFNFDNKESNIKLTSRNEINSWKKNYNLNIEIIDKNMSNFKKYINKTNINIKEFWIFTLILSLIFFTLEIFLIKFIFKYDALIVFQLKSYLNIIFLWFSIKIQFKFDFLIVFN